MKSVRLIGRPGAKGGASPVARFPLGIVRGFVRIFNSHHASLFLNVHACIVAKFATMQA